MIKIKNLNYKFKTNNFSLSNINLEIKILLETSSGEVENLNIHRFLNINLYNSNDTIIATHIDSIKYNQNNTKILLKT